MWLHTCQYLCTFQHNLWAVITISYFLQSLSAILLTPGKRRRWVFLPRNATYKHGLCRHAVSVRPSICLSVTFVDHVKTNNLPSVVGSGHVLFTTLANIGWTSRFIILFCLQPSQIAGLSGGVNRLCRRSTIYSQLMHIAGRQTDGKAISISK